MALVFRVSPEDHAGLEEWLHRQRSKYGGTAWFSLIEEAIQQHNWQRAWKLAAHVSILSHNEAYLKARTPEEAAAALRGTKHNGPEPISNESGAVDDSGSAPEAAATPESSQETAFLADLIGDLNRTTPKEWRALIGEILDVDLSDLESAEGLRALMSSLERREQKRIVALLNEGDRWHRTREDSPDPFPPEEPVLSHLADLYPALGQHGRARAKAVALHSLGIHSAEGLRLHRELTELGMERADYDGLIRRFANAVRRDIAVSRGTDACPVCRQYVVNPNLRKSTRWVASGIVNIGRTVVFLWEAVLVAVIGFIFLGGVALLVARLLGFASLD